MVRDFKKILIFIILLLIIIANISSTEVTQDWIKQTGTTSTDYGNSLTVDSFGNFYIVGYTQGSLDGETNQGIYDIFLTKYNSDGTRLWTKLAGTNDEDKGYGVAVDGSGNIYVTGVTDSNLDGQTNQFDGTSDIFLIKYDSEGTKLWTRLTGGVNIDEGKNVITDDSGNVYVIGKVIGDVDGETAYGQNDIVVIKYNTDGTKLWTKLIGTTSSENGNSIAVDDAENIYITGWTAGVLNGTNKGGRDIFIIKLKSSGENIWSKQIGTSSNDEGMSVTLDRFNDIYITGFTSGDLNGQTNNGLKDMFLAKYSNEGSHKWTRLIGTASNEEIIGFKSIYTDFTGNIYFGGHTKGNLNGETLIGTTDACLMKYDKSGALKWTKLLGGSAANAKMSGVAVDTSGNIAVTGYVDSALSGLSYIGGTGSDIFTAKYQDQYSGSNVWFIDNTIITDIDITYDSRIRNIDIPALAFTENIYITLNTVDASSLSTDDTKIIGQGIDLVPSKSIDPVKPINITLSYKDSDATFGSKRDFYIGRYDETTNTWIALDSTVDIVNNIITATTMHLSKFAILVALDSDDILVYPNPYNPANGNLKIKNVKGKVEYKIYTITGELVCNNTETASNFMVTWDGTNNGGHKVASGVYIMVIKDDVRTLKYKIAIER